MCERSLNRFGRIDSKSTSNLLCSSVNVANVIVQIDESLFRHTTMEEVQEVTSGVLDLPTPPPNQQLVTWNLFLGEMRNGKYK